MLSGAYRPGMRGIGEGLNERVEWNSYMGYVYNGPRERS